LTAHWGATPSGWIRNGKLVWKESVEQGIENAPTAFLKLFKGEKFGKMLLKLAPALACHEPGLR
jgi:NADPH-dependent curcumin reductase CurA